MSKVTVEPDPLKRRHARLLAKAREMLELYRRIDDVRKNGGTPLAELYRRVDARLAAESAEVLRAPQKRRRKT